ncbi:hypothetical protein BGZ70_000739, partial [Mortierella alpina]
MSKSSKHATPASFNSYFLPAVTGARSTQDSTSSSQSSQPASQESMGIIASKSATGSDSTQRIVAPNGKASIAPSDPQRVDASSTPFDSQDKDATMAGLDSVSNRVTLDSWQEQDVFSSQLDSLEEPDLFAFSSQRSVETLRRQTLSPKKTKRQKDYSLGSTLAKPMLTFSERLAAEMD